MANIKKPKKSKYKTDEDWYIAQLEASRKWKNKNREKTREYARNRYKNMSNSWEGYLQLMLKSAKTREQDCNLTIEHLRSLPQTCALTGKKFEFNNRFMGTFSNPLAPSIDRINPKKGYEIGNIQIVLNCINKMKSDMDNKEFQTLWKEIIQ